MSSERPKVSDILTTIFSGKSSTYLESLGAAPGELNIFDLELKDSKFPFTAELVDDGQFVDIKPLDTSNGSVESPNS